MINNSSSLVKGQRLKVDLEMVKDRLPREILRQLREEPIGNLIGYKMVDGNNFGLVLELKNGYTSWFFEVELSELNEEEEI